MFATAASRTVAKAMNQSRGYKVAVLGAAGGIGQPCGLLMKMVRPLIIPDRIIFVPPRRKLDGDSARAIRQPRGSPERL